MTPLRLQPLSGTEGKIGCLSKVLIAIAALIFLGAAMNFIEDWKERRAEHQRLQNLSEAENELRAFAQEQLPELQRVLHNFEDEIERRENMLDQLGSEMERLNRDPHSDPDFRRWSDAVREMRKERAVLLEKRTDAYLAYRKFELNPDSADDAAAREQRFHMAREAADQGRESFERLLREASGS